MNSRVIVVAAPLLALVAAIAIRRTLKERQSAAAVPEPAKTNGAATPSAQPMESVSAPQIVQAPIDAKLHAIGEAIETSYASTVAAFALLGEEADYATHDAKAQQDADRLQQLFDSVRPELSPELAKDCEAVVDRIAAAQLQLMAFAINRKNRGMPDNAQAETELADRKAFQEEAAPLFERIKSTLGV